MKNTTTTPAAQLPTFRTVADDAVTNLDIAVQGLDWAQSTLRMVHERLKDDPSQHDAAKVIDFVACHIVHWHDTLSQSTNQLDGQLKDLRSQEGEV